MMGIFKTKHSYEFVKKSIEGKGYTLLSKEYVNAKTKLEVKCSENHIFFMKLNDIQQGHGCPECAGNRKLTYDFVREFVHGEGHTLMSKEYVNNHTKLEILCPNKHTFEMSFNCFRRGQRCPECYGNKRHSYEYVKDFVEKEGYFLVSKEYKNAFAKIELRCPKGHLWITTFGRFKNGGSRCPECNGGIRLKYGDVNSFIEKEGYTLLSNVYNNTFDKIEVKCPKGHIYRVAFGAFKNCGNRCPICNAANKSSKAEKEILEIIRPLIKKEIFTNDRTQIVNHMTKMPLELDFWIPSLRKAIEFNGIYWHSKENMMIKDIIKKEQCEAKNINLLVIDEKDWLENKELCIKNLKSFLTS